MIDFDKMTVTEHEQYKEMERKAEAWDEYEWNLKEKDYRIEMLDMHTRNIEAALREVIELVYKRDEELGYDCEEIVDKWSQS